MNIKAQSYGSLRALVGVCVAMGLLSGSSPSPTVPPSLVTNGMELNGPGEEMQGIELNAPGEEMQGSEMNAPGEEMQGPRVDAHAFSGGELNGMPLQNLRIEAGELVAERNGVTLRGASLIGAKLQAKIVDRRTTPQTVTWREHRIANVQAELSHRDRFPTGQTYLYSIERFNASTGAWTQACPTDPDGLNAAIPIAAVWDTRGNRVESTSEFTFACTTGAIGKCYRWGYRPWIAHPDGPQVMKDAHQACTRMARADYCGDGRSHTQNGTGIMIWDTISSPGPIQTWAHIEGMVFEAGWKPNGAACLLHPRWITTGENPQIQCADRVIPPGVVSGNTVLCGNAAGTPSTVTLFNESRLNVQ